MAKSIKEIGKKAEALIEQGKDADKKVQSCQARVASSSSRVAAARRQLAAASETDEEGNPRGDVDAARAQLSMAQNQLAASQRALSTAQSDAERIRQQKNTQVREIERHNQVEKSNLEKLKQLRSSAFGSDSRALTEGMASRLNEAEDSRVALLRSMGIDATPEYISVSEGGGSASTWKGGNFSALDTAGSIQHYEGGGSNASDGVVANGKGIMTPLGGGLGNLISSIFGGKAGDGTIQVNSEEYADKQYTNRDELSDAVDFYASDYQAHPENYNDIIRNHGTTRDIENFRGIINSHHIGEDTIFYRRASMKDLGEQLANVPLDELTGKCYQFEGIMSTSGSLALSNNVSSGDVVFEFKVPKGTAGLDLTKVSYYQEAMFDSPYCYIESVRKEGFNTTHLVVRVLTEEEYKLINGGISSIGTHESLKQYMTVKYDIQLDDSISKLNIDTVKGAISGVETIIKDYPDVGTFLKSGITSSSGVMSCTGSKLSFNPDYFSDTHKLQATCTDMSNRGFWVKNASPTSIGVHEAAHGVEWALIQANHNYITDGQRVAAWNNCTEATNIVSEACANLKRTPYGAGKSSTDLVRSISTYAMENDSETMAEAFADVYANGENAKPLSKEIKRLTQQLMNKYKVGGI